MPQLGNPISFWNFERRVFDCIDQLRDEMPQSDVGRKLAPEEWLQRIKRELQKRG